MDANPVSTPALVLTLELDAVAMAMFERLRRHYYPVERNIVPAHMCLFHALPGGIHEDATRETVRRTAEMFAEVPLSLIGTRSLGRGVAVFFEAGRVRALHQALTQAFSNVLSAQDRQGFRPHVVVQNKVRPEVALSTLAAVTQERLPCEVRAIGLVLWRYLNGPWQELDRLPFGRTHDSPY